MPKLVIQIPCYNERESLPQTIADLPKTVFGVEDVEWLFIDDGSTDGTFEYLESLQMGDVIRLKQNLGLAKAYRIGLDAALAKGADIIVNTDADNQYKGKDIQRLIAPILRKKADLVIGRRNIDEIEDFSWFKKLFQKMGSKYMRSITGLKIGDAPSGFRAMSAKAARELRVYSDYTYTLETLVCAAHKKIRVEEIPIEVNPEIRPSRLISHNAQYICNAILSTLTSKVLYSPIKSLTLIGIPIAALSLLLLLSLDLSLFSSELTIFVSAAFLAFATLLLFCVALMANMIKINRRILESIEDRLPMKTYSNDASSNNISSSKLLPFTDGSMESQ